MLLSNGTFMNGTNPPTHIAFADETNYSNGRYPGIGVVTLAISDFDAIQSSLADLLRESNVSEFGWKNLKSARYKFAALKMITFAVEQCREGRMRIDVLTWDTQDRRHAVLLPDKIANLQIMYYHLCRNVLRMRWPATSVWKLHPDEHTAMNWAEVESRLDYASWQIESTRNLFRATSFGVVLRQDFNVTEVTEKSSYAEPLIQLADLFVGLAAFSRSSYDRYEVWKEEQAIQRSLFSAASPINLSTSDRERFPVLHLLDSICKRYRLGVSLATNRMLYTPDPANPINFWPYTPQHHNDRAPSRAPQHNH